MAVKRIPASTIAEVVIALTIIAVCFAVASQVFLQSNRSTVQFKEVKEQTEFQSYMLNAFMNDTMPSIREWKGELSTIEDETTLLDSSVHHRLVLSDNEKMIWEQDFFYEK